MSEITRQEFDALQALVSKTTAEVAEHRAVHVSRRGVQGAQGERGLPGPQGAPADPQQVAEITTQLVTKKFESLLKELEAEIAVAKSSLRWAVIEELRASGFVDAEGRAVPGPAGADSQVAGPAGRDGVGKNGVDGKDGVDGKSIEGPRGRDAKVAIGSVTSGDVASVTVREENGLQVLDFVLPRGAKGDTGATGASIVGPKGDSIVGPEGPRGFTGGGLSKQDVAALVQDMKRRGAL
jgi:hypothetical protein